MWDELPSGPPTRERRRFWPRSISEAGAAFATFLLSLTVFSVAGLSAVRGSRVVLIGPEEVVLYRDGGDNGVLSMSLAARMINAASQDYGDVAVLAEASIGPTYAPAGHRPRFRLASFTELQTYPQNEHAAAERQAASCPPGSRCVLNKGLVAIERPTELLDVPGGGSRTEELSFALTRISCKGAAAECARYQSFTDAAQSLRVISDLTVELHFKFHSDGRKAVRCRNTGDPATRKQQFDFLEERGWLTLLCEAP